MYRYTPRQVLTVLLGYIIAHVTTRQGIAGHFHSRRVRANPIKLGRKLCICFDLVNFVAQLGAC